MNVELIIEPTPWDIPPKPTLEYPIDEYEALVIVIRNWITPFHAAWLFNYAETVDIPWERPTWQLYGKPYTVPRDMFFCGDLYVKEHKYSGQTYIVDNWLDPLRDIRDRVYRETGLYHNAGLLQAYGPEDYIAYHSDNEALGPENSVFALVVGARRRFYFKNKRDKRVIKLEMGSGDAMLMLGATQRDWKHTVPKQAGITGNRYSLTLRCL